MHALISPSTQEYAAEVLTAINTLARVGRDVHAMRRVLERVNGAYPTHELPPELIAVLRPWLEGRAR